MNTTTPTEVAEVLEAAADDVYTKGLIKDEYGDLGGKRCAVGHLRSQTIVSDYSTFDEDEQDEAFGRYSAALLAVANALLQTEEVKAYYGETDRYPYFTGPLTWRDAWDVITSWNDLSRTSDTDVHDTFLHTAKDLRNG